LHTFLVVARKPGRVLPRQVRGLLASDDVSVLWFEPEAHVCWSSDAGNLHFAGWQTSSRLLEIGSYWHVANGAVAAFSGRPFPIEGAWNRGASWAAQLSRRFERLPLADSRERYRGVFTLASLTSAGDGAIATDPLGLGLIFFAETDEFAAFSNRAAVCASAIAPQSASPPRDPVAAGWLAYCGFILGEVSGFQGVRAMPQGAWIEFDGSGGFVLREPASAPWRFASPEAAADPDELIELVHDDIVAALRAAVSVPGPHTADITGGKDSRLILALLVSEGLADEVQFQTIGEGSLADVRIATNTTQRLGLKHHTHARLLLEAAQFEERLRVHVFQTSGMLGADDLIGRVFPAEHLHIAGACGEALRTNYPAYRDIRDARHALRAFGAGMHFDTLKLLKPEWRMKYDRWAADAFLALPWDVDEPVDLIDVFYLRQRLRRWLGPQQELNFSNLVLPLYSVTGIRAAFAIGASKRRAEFIPLELMRRYGADLLELPLASGSWGSEWAARPPRDPSTEPPSRAPDQRDAGTRAWQAQVLHRNREVLRNLLPSEPQHPALALFDRAAMASAIDRVGSLTLHERIQLYGAITATIWLGREESVWRLEAGW
jgi:hypothetical protein